MVTKPDAEAYRCALDVCGRQDVFQCCRNVGNCGDYNCPEGKVQREYAKHTQCDNAECQAEDEDKCCVESATCDSFTCPKCTEWKKEPSAIHCAHEECGEQDTYTCCSKVSEWLFGPPGQSCNEVCNNRGGCNPDDDVWPSRLNDFLKVSTELGITCAGIQPGESMYDPSRSGGRHCGWKPYKVLKDPSFGGLDRDMEASPAMRAQAAAKLKATEALYANIRCDAKPPPATQRFCVCSVSDMGTCDSSEL